MSVELPFAPVDSMIRRNAADLRVGSDATEELARRVQDRGAELARAAARSAEADGRKTLMAEDFDTPAVDQAELTLPIAPVDRIARLDIDDRYRVSTDARLALAGVLESYADEIADAAASLARHADRRTVKAEDVETYLNVCE
jgi:histone H3/H4